MQVLSDNNDFAYKKQSPPFVCNLQTHSQGRSDENEVSNNDCHYVSDIIAIWRRGRILNDLQEPVFGRASFTAHVLVDYQTRSTCSPWPPLGGRRVITIFWNRSEHLFFRDDLNQRSVFGLCGPYNTHHLQIHHSPHLSIPACEDSQRTLECSDFASVDSLDKISMSWESRCSCCTSQARICHPSRSEWVKCQWHRKLENCLRWRFWEGTMVFHLW